MQSFAVASPLSGINLGEQWSSPKVLLKKYIPLEFRYDGGEVYSLMLQAFTKAKEFSRLSC